MTKRYHTTTYYERRIAAAEAHLRRIQALARRLKLIADRRYAAGIEDSDEYYAKAAILWDRVHDELAKAEKRLAEAEDAYARRNWTSSDYYQWSLITDNID